MIYVIRDSLNCSVVGYFALKRDAEVCLNVLNQENKDPDFNLPYYLDTITGGKGRELNDYEFKVSPRCKIDSFQMKSIKETLRFLERKGIE